MPFPSLKIIEPILKAINDEWYTVPTPIQKQAIPIVLAGRDLLGCAQTGTGKTAAFAIPILQLLHAKKNPAEKRQIKTLIVTPTRELAIQIGQSFAAYGRYCWLRNTVIFGGVGQAKQTDALAKWVDILIATPGRLLDLIGQGYISLRHLEIFVLDEADRMLDMGFIHDIRKLLKLIPERRQTLFFSATMPPEIVELTKTILHDPEHVTITPVSSTVDVITQSVFFVDRSDKNNLLFHILKDQKIETVLIFTRTKHGADKVAKYLLSKNITAEAIHGNKSQNARQRALSNFKERKTRVLVATDIAARGIDIDLLSHVINFDIPDVSETYVHRIGRTGRAGASGVSYTFCDADDRQNLRDIEKLINKKIPVITDHPYPATNNMESSEKSSPSPRGWRNPRRPNERSPKPNSNNPHSRGATSSRAPWHSSARTPSKWPKKHFGNSDSSRFFSS